MASIPSSSSDTPNTVQPNLPHSQRKEASAILNDDVGMSEKLTGDIKLDAVHKKPDIEENFRHMDNAENIQKFKKYHADYTRYLMAKYFSGKNLCGGNIFETEVNVDNFTIKASRWPCTRSFADPVQSFEDNTKLSATCTTKAPMNVPNRKKSSS